MDVDSQYTITGNIEKTMYIKRFQMILLFIFIYEKTMYIVKHILNTQNFCLRV